MFLRDSINDTKMAFHRRCPFSFFLSFSLMFASSNVDGENRMMMTPTE
jgi:hypothetical protein